MEGKSVNPLLPMGGLTRLEFKDLLFEGPLAFRIPKSAFPKHIRLY